MTEQAVILIDENQWPASLATTYAELVQGLSGVLSMPAGTGMLFILPADQPASVTTELLQFNIDIIFISSSLNVVDVARNVAPGMIVTESTPVRYFLEINAGEADGIESGDMVDITVYQQAGTLADWISPLVSIAGLMAVGVFMASTVRSVNSAIVGETTQNPPAVRLVGIAPKPPRPGELVEREEAKLERRRRGLRPGTHIELLTPEEHARILQLRAQGLSLSQIAARVGRSQSAVYRTIQRGRLPLRRALTSERLQEVTSLRRKGLSAIAIGRELGITRRHVYWLLHRAGERVDLRGTAEELQRKLLAVNDILRAPATIPKMEDAANKLRDIFDDAELILQITPRIPYVGYAGPQPYDIGFKAGLAEEVLRTGIWCMERRQKGYEARKIPGVDMREVEIPPRQKEVLGMCGEAAREAAQGTIRDEPGYETKSAQILAIVEEMMREAKE
ncbi:MAG: DUF192 domain-containing protein [Desulfobacterales bacterium]|nr:DUF192 domain-containing protein [Desulfobacterales bacterium]